MFAVQDQIRIRLDVNITSNWFILIANVVLVPSGWATVLVPSPDFVAFTYCMFLYNEARFSNRHRKITFVLY